MNIAFVTIFNRTFLYKAIADNLVKNGHNVYWITTSNKWEKWLINNGVDQDKILLITRDACKEKNLHKKDYADFIHSVESSTGVCIKSVYFMDRIIRGWDWKEAEKYLIYLMTNIYNFILQKDISIVFGETTKADEILSSLICSVLGKKFLNPSTLRIPSERFVFFHGHMQTQYEMFASEMDISKYLKDAEIIRDQVTKGGKKPNYWYRNRTVPKVNGLFIKKIANKLIECFVEAKSDASVKSLSYHLMQEKKFLKPLNYCLVNNMKIFDDPQKGEKYILYPLQKQPEASINVFCEKYINQFELVSRISRSLPQNVMLYVKEHANSLGDRSVFELMKIKQLPGVRLINPLANIHDLIKGSKLVVTPTGTAAFEAGIFGIPSITFTKMFFNQLTKVAYLDSVDKLLEYIKSMPENKDDYDFGAYDQKIIATMLANSFEGDVSDPVSNPNCMSKENIDQVSKGFLRIIEN